MSLNTQKSTALKGLLFILFILFNTHVFGQETTTSHTELRVEKKNFSKQTQFIIKPNRYIRLKTTDKRKYSANDFSLIGDSLIVIAKDTIALKNITTLYGQVRGDVFRKMIGFITSLTGSFVTAGGVLFAVYAVVIAQASVVYLLAPIPGFIILKLGEFILKGRKFNTSEKWSLKVYTRVI